MKERGNKLFAGSRMMLPEHREMLMRRTEAETWLPKPILDEQRYEEMEMALQEVLLNDHRNVRLSIWRPQGTAQIKGQLRRINPLKGTLDLQVSQERIVSVYLEDLLEVHLDTEMTLE